MGHIQSLQRIPLMILTGFLGAGKTTLLNRILSSEHGLKIAVMVNDFGAINIDAQLVVDVDQTEDMVNLSNGCICCTIRGDLINSTQQLINRDEPPDYIIIETSGVSDPIDVVLTLRQVPQIQIESVQTVIDAEQVLDIDAQYRDLALNQIGTADLIIVNKIDLVDEMQLGKVRQHIHKITKDARVIEAAHAQVPLELLLGAGHYDPQRLANKSRQAVHIHDSRAATHDHHHTIVFETWHWQTEQSVSYQALKRTIDKLPDSIYRAKGLFYLNDFPQQRALVQIVGKRVSIDLNAGAWGDESPYSRFVVIGSAGAIDAEILQDLMDRCLAMHTPSSELGQLVSQAISWLRGKR